jgi:hypothetical protein
MARVALVGVVAALVVVSDGSAAPKVVTIAITATGPSPSTVRIRPSEEFGFVNHDSVAHTLWFARRSKPSGYCNLNPVDQPPPTIAPCGVGIAERVGRIDYSVDNQFPGNIVVVALTRSVTLTARTHSVRLGSQLTLHGQETYHDRTVTAVCTESFGTLLRVFARQAANKPFKRIAMFSLRTPTHKRPGRRGCSYRWQLKVRPGITTTYIAQTERGAWFKRATSKPFTVMVRG